MSHPASAAPPGHRESPDPTGVTPGRKFSYDAAASRITAFVYGNILILAALVALHPQDLEGAKGGAYVLGTALSTYVAHVVAELTGSRVRPGAHSGGANTRHALRDAVPILSSASIPVAVLIAARLGWLDTTTALQVAPLAVILRLATLGWVVGRLAGRPASWRTFLSGVVLALAGTAAALLKWHLTH